MPSTKSKPRPADQLTPAMRQYVDQKQQVGDAVLLFRMGDFYETFYDDAKLVSKVLGITLTARSKDSANPVPLAGIPYHALNNYLTRLVKAGYRVAISEQVEDPKLAKGVVKREVVRIVTAGTLTDDALLDEQHDNVLAAICDAGKGQVGLAVAELASGRFEAFGEMGTDALDELIRLRPAELLIDEETKPDSTVARIAAHAASQITCPTTKRPRYEFDSHNAERTLHRHFDVATLAGFGFDRMDASLQAAGAILAYLGETQKTALSHVRSIRRHETGMHVRIDANSWRSLEIERTLREGGREGSLCAAIDRTVHPIGTRRLHRWLCSPTTDVETILSRQEAIAYLFDRESTRKNIRVALKSMADVERIAARVAMARATPRDLAGLSRALAALPDLCSQIGEPVPPMLEQIRVALTGLDELSNVLNDAIQSDAPMTLHDGGIIQPGYDAELDRLHAVGRDGQSWLAQYQQQLIGETGINSLKVGFNRVFGYYIEVTHAHADRVPNSFVRKQTMKNAERYITDELKKFETEALTAEEKARDLEAAIFERLRKRIADDIDDVLRVANAIGELDSLAGLAELAVRRRYVRPQLTDEPVLTITAGRHPVLEAATEKLAGNASGGFVPNDCDLDTRAARVMVITGPNMAGKSTYIRQVALITLLAQTGSFVPAEAMTFQPVDRIFARVGASDEISRGQSTFMVEMTEAAHILNHATPRSLVVLDELGRGTSTFDGLSLAWAITEHLANQTRCFTLMATHYHELTELAELLDGVRNFNVAVRESNQPDDAESIVFLHRIVPGGTDKSYGLHVARLAGVPRAVVTRSREVLAELERGFARESHGPQLARKRSKDDSQMQLFTDPGEEIIKALQSIDVNDLTPIEALQKLKELQDQVHN